MNTKNDYQKGAMIMVCVLLSSCATIQDYVPSSIADAPLVSIVREFNQPILGSTTTIYQVDEVHRCAGNSSGAPATRFMVLDEGNPLVADFNAQGVKVAPEKSLHLKFFSVAGYTSCSNIVAFTPQSGKDYQIKLQGSLFGHNAQCSAQLYSTTKGTNELKKESFSLYDDCHSATAPVIF